MAKLVGGLSRLNANAYGPIVSEPMQKLELFELIQEFFGIESGTKDYIKLANAWAKRLTIRDTDSRFFIAVNLDYSTVLHCGGTATMYLVLKLGGVSDVSLLVDLNNQEVFVFRRGDSQYFAGIWQDEFIHLDKFAIVKQLLAMNKLS